MQQLLCGLSMSSVIGQQATRSCLNGRERSAQISLYFSQTEPRTAPAGNSWLTRSRLSPSFKEEEQLGIPLLAAQGRFSTELGFAIIANAGVKLPGFSISTFVSRVQAVPEALASLMMCLQTQRSFLAAFFAELQAIRTVQTSPDL